MNYGVLKEWYLEDWKKMDLTKFRDESFTKLADLGHIEVPSNILSQLAGSKIFEDKIMLLKRKEARDFAKMTKEKKRKDMSMEAYKMWARSMIKMIFKQEFTVIIMANFDKLDTNEENRERYGKMLDMIHKHHRENENSFTLGRDIDEIVKKVMPELLDLEMTGFEIMKKIRVYKSEDETFALNNITENIQCIGISLIAKFSGIDLNHHL